MIGIRPITHLIPRERKENVPPKIAPIETVETSFTWCAKLDTCDVVNIMLDTYPETSCVVSDFYRFRAPALAGDKYVLNNSDRDIVYSKLGMWGLRALTMADSCVTEWDNNKRRYDNGMWDTSVYTIFNYLSNGSLDSFFFIKDKVVICQHVNSSIDSVMREDDVAVLDYNSKCKSDIGYDILRTCKKVVQYYIKYGKIMSAG